DTAEFAKADGWQGEEGYFKAKYREVYVSRNGLSDMFSEHTEKIVKVNTDDYTVSTIQYVDGLVNIENKDASKQTEYYLFAWREGDTIKWWTDADVAILDANLKNMFNGNYKNNIVSFDFSGFDVRDVTGLNETFSNCKNLESVTFGNMFYADKLQNTYRMFGSCEKLKSVDMTDLHAGSGSLTNVKNMFENCYSLEDLTFASDFDTSNVTSTNSMFFNCRALKSIDVSSFDFAKVTDAYRTFSGLNEVTSITLPQVCDLQNCTTMCAMFEKCYKLETLDLSCIKTSNKLTNLSYTFNESKALKNIDLSGWNISAVTNYKCTFRNCEDLESIVMKGGKSQGTDRGNLFAGCKGGEAGVIKIKLEDWNFQASNHVGEFISTCTIPLVDYDISGSNMNNSTSFANLVKNRTNMKLRSIDLSGLKNVGKVTSMESAFSKCNYLESVEFGDFDLSFVTNFREMFNTCSSLESVDLSGVTNNRVDTVYWMFLNCSSLKTVDFGNISFENLNTATNAFSGCGELTTVYVSDSYKLKSGVNNQDMFANNNKLKGSAGTEYSNSKKKAIYAWPDGKDGREGYFTIR
nr:BspA family leucine-rich repeat surface protein [Lachnospiraceae bacterium]